MSKLDAKGRARAIELEGRDAESLAWDLAAAEERERVLREALQWVSVTERLPEERGAGTTYLVTLRTDRWPDMVMEAAFRDGQFHRIAGDFGPISCVSDWMPMPAPALATPAPEQPSAEKAGE